MTDIVERLRGRPKINRELEAAERRLREIKDGVLATYEWLEMGRNKLTRQEAKVAAIRAASDNRAPEDKS